MALRCFTTWRCMPPLVFSLRNNWRDVTPLLVAPCELFQTRYMSTPKIRVKPDRALDVVTTRDKLLRPIMGIRDLILREGDESIRIRLLENRRWDLGLKMKNITVRGFMRRFPNMFEIYTSSRDNQPWCRLTEEMRGLIEEEKQIYLQLEPQNVEKLKRLLMMAKKRRIRAENLEQVRQLLGFPEEVLTKLVTDYPQFFRVVSEGLTPYLELLAWDESLAVSDFEKRAKENARKRGLGEIETRGQPLSFKVSYPPGMALRKKNLEVLTDFQKLPYVSPYQDWSSVQPGTALSDKRIVALLHEVLCLTIEKKFLVRVVARFREELGLPQKVDRFFDRYPGIFYLSLKGSVKTVVLREGYRESTLIEDHPLVHLKDKYSHMVYEGPRLRASRSKPKDEARTENIATEESPEDQAGIDEFFQDSTGSEGDEADGYGGDYCVEQVEDRKRVSRKA